ncbi:MAG TPA: S-adenosylmethionine decarboxylase [Bryobacteraceae bacterium]|nr:S-adenosylmethionine decarboxylase [Bryobacteraceae bacterium]
MCGCEWIIEAHGCNPQALTNTEKLKALFARLIDALDLHTVREASWHQFPGAGGITGMCLLAESHLACHTFPEYHSLCLNVFCCRPRAEWDFGAYLKKEFSARSVSVRRIERPYLAAQDESAGG